MIFGKGETLSWGRGEFIHELENMSPNNDNDEDEEQEECVQKIEITLEQ